MYIFLDKLYFIFIYMNISSNDKVKKRTHHMRKNFTGKDYYMVAGHLPHAVP